MTTEKKKYICKSCNYKFSRQADIDFNKICPYCGKQTVVENTQTEAQKLLNDADKLLFDD